MTPDLATVVRLGLFVKAAESDAFLSEPHGLDLSALVYASRAVLFWRDLRGARTPCAILAEDSTTGKLTIACRGTDSIWEWLDDARFAQRPCKWAPGGCLVENGFGDVYDSTSLEDGSDFRPLLTDRAGLTIAGHSLGAAWAVQAAGDLGAGTCVAFACPKVGNPQLAIVIEGRVPAILRPTNSHDVVPLLPASFRGVLSYQNPGPELPLNSAGVVCHGPMCAHHLTTYLHLLDSAQPLDEDCSP